MTVAENMAFGLKLASVDKREIARRRGGRGDPAAGQAARTQARIFPVASASASPSAATMVREPKVFLFDEPLSNLDAFLRVQMRIEIARLHQRIRSTMIYVTHDRVEADPGRQDRRAQRRRDRPVGQPLHLYHYPKNRFVAGFLGSPQMNFVEVRAISASPGGGHHRTAQRLPTDLPVDGSAVSPGDPLTLGIRPEHFVMRKKPTSPSTARSPSPSAWASTTCSTSPWSVCRM